LKPAGQHFRWIVAASIAATVGLGLWAYTEFFAWKKFAVVADGALYRSGLLNPDQLEQAIDRYQIRTVFSFTFTERQEQEKVCAAKGVKRYFAYLPGDGVGPDDPYLRFIEIASDPANHPILVHCSAGVQRTGGAVALYRTVIEGWDFDRAVAEMVSMGNRGRPEQVDQLRHLRDELMSSKRCLINIPRMASSRR
jgi:tyrosine-protein phosphatase SIW14